MGAVYSRKGSRFLWLKYVDRHGQEQRRSSETGDEKDARALLAEIERQERHPVAHGDRGVSVEKFFDETWLPLRKSTVPNSWMTDASLMRNNFLSSFGARSLKELASEQGEVELLDWLMGLRKRVSTRDGKPLAPRTIRNAANAVRVFFEDALERKLVARNPTAGWKVGKHIPDIADKDPRWRRRAGFGAPEVARLLTDPAISEERRALYALRFLAGLRPGEAANARWSDLDKSARPLWRLTLSTSWSSQAKREKDTKTGAEINVPVHPVLRRTLEAWEAEGWERFMGRRPVPGDLIFPRLDGRQRATADTGHAFRDDLARLGIPHQRQYETRSTFRNLALRAGASEFHLNLITHPAPRRGSDFYTRLDMQWEQMCQAVMTIELPGVGVTDEVTAEVTAGDVTKDKAPEPFGSGASVLAGPRGFEPLAVGFVDLLRGWRGPRVHGSSPVGPGDYAFRR